ncbi:PQQ-like beta-propeller repeat protein [Actinoplanes sp. DH11]|uniref:PQQ-like beta-propeller repeat protein n=1 Tax=Actinoplanes sp. DH11 TaxID=2857011 RepID=UPI001E48487D|nr:PQQ-like beta-propeller repeat protein [Actinoplanes sp. DH11]
MTDPEKSPDAAEAPASEAEADQDPPSPPTTPDPAPSPSPSPSPEPSPEPSPSPEPESSPRPLPEPDPEPAPSPGFALEPGPVVFTSGVAPAADPEPTPTTLGNLRNTEPVDPWAGHETVFPTPVHGHYAYSPETPAPPPRRRRRTWLLGLLAAGVTGVLAVTTAAVVYYWPQYPALDFQRLTETARFGPAVPVSSAFADTTVVGERFYFASSDAAGTIGVTAVDGTAEQPAWNSTAAGTAARWDNMSGLPYGLVITGRTESADRPIRVAVLGADRGDLLWDLELGGRDQTIFGKSVAIHVDRAGHRLIGLDATTGTERWRLADVSETGTRTLAVTAPGDLSGPASARGRPFTPALSDARLVQINADHSVRVVDMNSGTVGKSWQTGAAVDDEVFAHNGRLVVRESGSVERVVAYDLTTGAPTLLHTAEQGARLTRLTACGNDSVCFTKGRPGAREQTVLRLSLTGDTENWESGPLTDVVRLVPVGDSVVVQGPDATTLLDAAGTTAWTHPGTVARLDSGNMLRFGHVFTGAPIDESLSGQHVGDQPVELGAIYDVRTETCAWTTTLLGCVTADSYATYRFAD